MHEGFGYSIAPWGFHRRVAGLQAELTGEDARVASEAGQSVVAEHLDRGRCAVKVEPRLSTAAINMSRTSDPLMPAFSTAHHAMIFRSWASMTKAFRRTSPFQQANWKPSLHQRRSGRGVTTSPSRARSGRSKLRRASSGLCPCMIRYTRFVVHRCSASCMQLPVHNSCDPSMATGRPHHHQRGDQRHHVRDASWPSACVAYGLALCDGADAASRLQSIGRAGSLGRCPRPRSHRSSPVRQGRLACPRRETVLRPRPRKSGRFS